TGTEPRNSPKKKLAHLPSARQCAAGIFEKGAVRSVSKPKRVCGRCIRNPGLQDFIADEGTRSKCGFCGRRSSQYPAVPLEVVVEFMRERIDQSFDDALNALPYESAEGGYHGAAVYTRREQHVEEV